MNYAQVFEWLVGKDWQDILRRAVKTGVQGFVALLILVLLGQATLTVAGVGAIVAGALSIIQNAMSRDPSTKTLL